jgi:capsular exopolysaccharide synthesis family protein
MAASVSNIKVIQPPLWEGIIVAPKKAILYTACIGFAILFAAGIVFISGILNKKINDENDIQDINVIGQIPKSPYENTVMKLNERSYLSESFRMLRTNINFLFDNQKKCPIIAISSTMPSEGKTFISVNLAQTFASSEKRVILVGLDLRLPKLSDYLDCPHQKGVSNFIVDHTISPESIIQNSNHNENFFFIHSGDIPPNPAELLLKPRFKELLNYLKENFDLIILDTSPIGIISDCIPVIKNDADILLYVARIGFLDKKSLEIPKSYIRDGLVNNLHIVLNHSKPLEKRYGYGYAYTNPYTESYFAINNLKPDFYARLKKWFKLS